MKCSNSATRWFNIIQRYVVMLYIRSISTIDKTENIAYNVQNAATVSITQFHELYMYVLWKKSNCLTMCL